MSNYNQSLIEDYRQTIERLQKECTEKTNAIIALGEHLKAKEQECEELEKYAQAQENQRETYYKEYLKLSQQCEALKSELELYKTRYCAKHGDVKNIQEHIVKLLRRLRKFV